MKSLFVCDHADTCKSTWCEHIVPHHHSEECFMDCTLYKSSECKLDFRAHVEYQPNRISHGEESPHYGTEYQDMYAGLTIEKNGKKYFFRCADYQYDENVPQILDDLVNNY